ncbi:hypothetical protein [Flavobacterium chungbukense]|uniref:Uncharacterized protein n=1 Tax=Flavobacterium chungbukense TaxID=877464 RepID=A0ABP7YVB0_9FLAO|nr:hypothetical protein [Flavobacterium chungbukense]MCC4923239.1 hypothetical protein [Flavobacterium chungbukense]
MSRENQDSCDHDERTYHAADDSINSELLEKKDPAINQHENDTTGIHSDASEHANPRPDERDPDADRRTLDEEKAVEDDDDQDN